MPKLSDGCRHLAENVIRGVLCLGGGWTTSFDVPKLFEPSVALANAFQVERSAPEFAESRFIRPLRIQGLLVLETIEVCTALG